MSCAVPKFPERWCPNGQHWVPREHFAEKKGKPGILERDCRACLSKKREAWNEDKAGELRQMAGVDIDAIHARLEAGQKIPGVRLLKRRAA